MFDGEGGGGFDLFSKKSCRFWDKPSNTEQRGPRGGSACVFSAAGNPSRVAASLTLFGQNSHWHVNQKLTALTSESPPLWGSPALCCSATLWPFPVSSAFLHIISPIWKWSSVSQASLGAGELSWGEIRTRCHEEQPMSPLRGAVCV